MEVVSGGLVVMVVVVGGGVLMAGARKQEIVLVMFLFFWAPCLVQLSPVFKFTITQFVSHEVRLVFVCLFLGGTMASV